MATDLYTVTLQAESKGVTQTKQAMDGLGKSTGLATKAIGLFGAAFAGIGIASTFKKITQDTMAFTKSISELSAITGATGKDLEFYEKQAALIGKTTTLSASQAATAFKLIASAKPDLLQNSEALAAVTKEAVKLAEAAGVDLADAASTVGVSLNQFGADASEAARFVNVLAAGAKEGSSSIEDTSMAMKNAGVAARLAGLSFEEANVGVQLLAKGGLFAAEAGTGFRQVLLKLENEAEDKFKPSMVGLAGALENLAAENMNLTELTDLFGAEAMKSAAIMINGAKDARTLEAALTGTSTATEMAATNFDNMTGDLLSLDSANEGLAITLGQMLEPAMRKTIQAVTDFSRAADDFVKSDKFIKYLEIAINALKLISVIIVSQLIGALAAAVTSFAAAATAATLFGSALTLMGGPIGVTVIALYGLYEILNKVVGTNTDNLTRELQTAANKGVEPLAEHIKELEQRQIKLKKAVDAATQSAKYSSAAANQLSSSQAELEAVTNSLADAEILLEEKLSLSNITTDVSSAATDALSSEFEALQRTIVTGLNPALEVHTEKYTELTDELNKQMTQVGMNKREQFLYNQQLKLGTEATLEERLAVETLAGTLFDAENKTQEVKVAVEELTVAQEIHKNMIENVQKSFGDLIYKTLDDGKLNFKSFFTSVLDGFKTMIAELAAQKIMNAIFGDGGLNGFLSSLSGGFSSIFATIGSSIASMASQAASGIASIVGGGAAAGGAAAGGAAAGGAAAGGATAGGATVGGTLAAGAAKVGGTLAAAGSKALALATGPAGLAVLATAALAKVLDSGGTPTSTAGLTMAKTAGMSDANIFQTDSFASGFAPLGFKQNATNEQAEAAINPIRQLDASLTEIASGLGYNVDLSGHTFSGLGVEGTGAGTVLGTFVEKGSQKGTSLDEQLDNYASEWIKAVGARNGVSEQVIKDVIGGGSASGILKTTAGLVDGSHESGLSSVPFDGYIAELHAGERVQTSAQVAATDNMASEMVGLRNNLNELMLVVAKAVTKTARIEDRWDKNGLPPVRA
jgi:TP901 family phage tail tape measure protein